MSDVDATATSEESPAEVSPVEAPVPITDQPESQEQPAPVSGSAPEPTTATDPATPPDPAPVVEDAEPVVEDVALVAETVATADAAAAGLTWIPFALYLTAWVALATATGFLLRGATPESPARWMPEYPALLWTGVGLTAAGPVVSLVVWLVARARREAGDRHGLLASSMLRGALMTVVGVALWLGILYAIEVVTVNGALG